jgi:hypothetical protein
MYDKAQEIIQKERTIDQLRSDGTYDLMNIFWHIFTIIIVQLLQEHLSEATQKLYHADENKNLGIDKYIAKSSIKARFYV